MVCILTVSSCIYPQFNLNLGQLLYHEALKQLETIEKKHLNTTTNTENDNRSITDRIIRKIATMWSSSTDTAVIQTPAMKGQQSKEFEAAIALLEKSAREYENNDALLVLAELNFVSKHAIYHTYSHTRRVINM